jgi:hypothetical protein
MPTSMFQRKPASVMSPVGQPTLPGITVHAHDHQAVLVRKPLDGGALVLRGVLLVLSGHVDVFRGPYRTG